MPAASPALRVTTTNNDAAARQQAVCGKLCWLDNTLGYRYGFCTWLSFWIPSFVVLLADDTQGAARAFLAQGTLVSSLTLVYFCYHFSRGSPASTPATHAITAECFARLALLAQHGAGDVVDASHAVGAMSVAIVCAVSMFGILNLTKLLYILFHPAAYAAYEEEQRQKGVR